jgi:hypothetical protein
VVQIPAGLPALLVGNICGSQFFQVNFGIVGHDRFLPHPVQLIIRQSFHHLTPYIHHTDGAVEQLTEMSQHPTLIHANTARARLLH